MRTGSLELWLTQKPSERACERFDSVMATPEGEMAYGVATETDKSICKNRSNRLQDEAMALCGHPCYKVTNTEWNANEIAFLKLFVA